MTPLICPFMSGTTTTQTLVGERDQLFEAPCLGKRCALWVVVEGSGEPGGQGTCGVLAGRLAR